MASNKYHCGSRVFHPVSVGKVMLQAYTGFVDLDKILAGLHKTPYNFAARPGMGNSPSLKYGFERFKTGVGIGILAWKWFWTIGNLPSLYRKSSRCWARSYRQIIA